MPIKTGEIYETNKYGKIKILKKERKKWSGRIDVRTKYYIEFLNTGYKKWCVSSQIYKKTAKDDTFDKYIGKILRNNIGIKFKIISYVYKNLETRKELKTKFYKIKFIKSGNIVFKTQSDVLSGRVKDNFYPSVYGVGYIGSNNIKTTNHLREYGIWSDMIGRCYHKKNNVYKWYGEQGVKVDERWHSFKNFLEDIKKIDNYKSWKNSDEKYCLDKDKKQKYIDNKIYSLNTCSFIKKSENILLAIKKTFFIAINTKRQEKIYCNNQTEFERNHNVFQSNISRCLSGDLDETNGWRFISISEKEYLEKLKAQND